MKFCLQKYVHLILLLDKLKDFVIPAVDGFKLESPLYSRGHFSCNLRRFCVILV